MAVCVNVAEKNVKKYQKFISFLKMSWSRVEKMNLARGALVSANFLQQLIKTFHLTVSVFKNIFESSIDGKDAFVSATPSGSWNSINFFGFHPKELHGVNRPSTAPRPQNLWKLKNNEVPNTSLVNLRDWIRISTDDGKTIYDVEGG